MSNELKELQKITKILTFAHSDSLEKAISEYASTDERKIAWVLINGINMPEDIAKRIGRKITKWAIYDFLKILEEAKLIENPKRKPPKRLIEFVPASWIELLEGKKEKKKKDERKRS